MSKSFSDIPSGVSSCFWSYDVSQLDFQRDRNEIITQIFNYGNWEAVKWVRKIYSDKEIRSVLKKPARGRWFKQALNFWLLEFGMKLSNAIKRRAFNDQRVS